MFGVPVVFSCKKTPERPDAGKWYETRLRMYALNGKNVVYDTTYYQPFSRADFLQLDMNGACLIGSDHYYYPNDGEYPKTPQPITADTAVMNYSPIASGYLLTITPQITNYAGFNVGDTLFFTRPNTMVLHSVFHSFTPGYTSVSDATYSR